MYVVVKTVNFDGERLVLYQWGVSLSCVMISCYTTLKLSTHCLSNWNNKGKAECL